MKILLLLTLIFVLCHCNDELKEDVKEVMENCDGCSNHDLLRELVYKLRLRWNWYILGFIVYDGVSGFDNHHVGGSGYVHNFRINGKNAIAFWRPQRFSTSRCTTPNNIQDIFKPK